MFHACSKDIKINEIRINCRAISTTIYPQAFLATTLLSFIVPQSANVFNFITPFCSLYFDFQHFHRDYVVFSAADYVPNKVLSPRSNSDQFK